MRGLNDNTKILKKMPIECIYHLPGSEIANIFDIHNSRVSLIMQLKLQNYLEDGGFLRDLEKNIVGKTTEDAYYKDNYRKIDGSWTNSEERKYLKTL